MRDYNLIRCGRFLRDPAGIDVIWFWKNSLFALVAMRTYPRHGIKHMSQKPSSCIRTITHMSMAADGKPVQLNAVRFEQHIDTQVGQHDDW